MNAHVPTECPRLSQERKLEWRNSGSTSHKRAQVSNPHKRAVTHASAVKVRGAPAIRMIGGAQEEDRSDSEDDDAGVDVTDVYTSRVAKVSQPEEKFTRTWPALVPVCNSLRPRGPSPH